jgi:hypothetical protein
MKRSLELRLSVNKRPEMPSDVKEFECVCELFSHLLS